MAHVPSSVVRQPGSLEVGRTPVVAIQKKGSPVSRDVVEPRVPNVAKGSVRDVVQ